MPEKIEAKVTHRFPAPPDRVFDAFVDPALVRLWQEAWLNHHGGKGEITGFSYDPQMGGQYRIEGVRDGEQSQSWGTFLALDRPTRVSYTFLVDQSEEDDPSLVTIIIEPEPGGNGAIVTLYNEMGAEWADWLPQTERAWMNMLDAIDMTLRLNA
ncbi:SRPBCC family protein [Devosia sp. CAU 1758]